MRRVNPGRSFQEYLSGRKLIEIVEEDKQPAPVREINEHFKQLVELTRQYRHYQRAYFAKRKKGEFAKDEEHFMVKYQDKIDNLISHINL